MAFEAGKQIADWTLVSDVDAGLVAPLWVADNGKHVAYLRNYRVRSVAVTQRLEKVASWAASFDHNNILPMRKVHEVPGGVAVVSAYEEGQPLASVLGRARIARKTMPPAVAASLAIDMLDGLHAMGGRLAPAWAHGGLRPEAVLVTRAGRARIMEVGITGVLATVDPFSTDAKWAAYSAPEQLDGSNLGGPADVFIAAAILWEMLVGRPLFEARDVPALKKRILEGAKERPDQAARTEVPKALSVVVAQALERDPDDRYEAASAFANAIRSAVLEVAEQAEVATYLEDLQQVALDTRRRVLTEALGRPAPTSIAPPRGKTPTIAPKIAPTAPLPRIEPAKVEPVKVETAKIETPRAPSVRPAPAVKATPSKPKLPTAPQVSSVLPKPPTGTPLTSSVLPKAPTPRTPLRTTPPPAAVRTPTPAPAAAKSAPPPPVEAKRSAPPPAEAKKSAPPPAEAKKSAPPPEVKKSAPPPPSEEIEIESAPLSAPPDDPELDALFQEPVPEPVPSEAYSVVGLSDPEAAPPPSEGYSVVGLSEAGEAEGNADAGVPEAGVEEPAPFVAAVAAIAERQSEPPPPPVEQPPARAASEPPPPPRAPEPSIQPSIRPPVVTHPPYVPDIDEPIPVMRPRRRWPFLLLGILIGAGGALGVVYRAPHLLPVPPPRPSATAPSASVPRPEPRASSAPADSTLPEAPVIDEGFEPEPEEPLPEESAAAPSAEPAPKAPPKPAPAKPAPAKADVYEP
jgi:hypothetical protein